MRKYQLGTTGQVRAAAKKLKTFTPTDIVYAVDPAEKYRAKSIRNIVTELCLRGEFKRIAPGKYEYVEDRSPTADVREKVMRAMHVKGIFNIKGIRQITDADATYIGVLIRKLVKAGDLEFVGKTNRCKYYRVRNADAFYLDRVNNGGDHGV